MTLDFNFLARAVRQSRRSERAIPNNFFLHRFSSLKHFSRQDCWYKISVPCIQAHNQYRN